VQTTPLMVKTSALAVRLLVEDGRIVGVESAAYELPSECELVDHGNATVGVTTVRDLGDAAAG
jgi:hypothetical protein